MQPCFLCSIRFAVQKLKVSASHCILPKGCTRALLNCYTPIDLPSRHGSMVYKASVINFQFCTVLAADFFFLLQLTENCRMANSMSGIPTSASGRHAAAPWRISSQFMDIYNFGKQHTWNDGTNDSDIWSDMEMRITFILNLISSSYASPCQRYNSNETWWCPPGILLSRCLCHKLLHIL